MRFRIVNACNGYFIHDGATDCGVVLGDGVDQPYGEVGTEEFRRQWENDANLDIMGTFEVYFPDLANLNVWDNNGRTADCYTVIFAPYEKRHMNALALNDRPENPHSGVSQFCSAIPGIHLGERKHFLDLPPNVQKHIARRLDDRA